LKLLKVEKCEPSSIQQRSFKKLVRYEREKRGDGMVVDEIDKMV